ncbi:MAG TPA: protein kinase, partial [Myxococcaceae bacterium]
VSELARQVLEILVYLHGLSPKIIHRDLKPANIMRRPSGELALVDFGAARDLVRGATHRSTLVGTFGYMPPEQLGGTVDETSDLYALGATLIHLLSRKAPDELLRSGMEIAFEDAVNVSPGLKAFLARLIERDRARRFPSATAALQALDALDHSRPQPVSHFRLSHATRRDLFQAGVVSVMLILVFIGGRLWVDSQQPPAVVPPPLVEAPVSRPPPPLEDAVPAPPGVPSPSSPAPAKPLGARQRPAPQEGEVAEVITLRKTGQSRPFLLPKDVRLTVGREVSLGDTATCGPRASTAEVGQVQLQAEGGGTLEAPRSHLSVDMTLRNHGATGSGCHRAVLRLKDASGRSLAPDEVIENTATGTERSRTLQFIFPRTERQVRLQVGTADAPGTTFVLDLVNGTVR